MPRVWGGALSQERSGGATFGPGQESLALRCHPRLPPAGLSSVPACPAPDCCSRAGAYTLATSDLVSLSLVITIVIVIIIGIVIFTASMACAFFG